MKICNQCEKEKCLEGFYIDRKAGSIRSNGQICNTTVYRQPCKQCLTYNKRQRYATDTKFRQKQKDAANKWAKSDAGVKKRRIAARNRTKTAKFKRYRKWYSKHTKKGRACRKKQRAKWLKSPNGRVYHQRKAERRRARKRGAKCTLTKSEWNDVLRQYDGRCAYCGQMAKLTQDHIVSLVLGGEHSKRNVVPACKMCNSKKGIQLWQPLSSSKIKSLVI